MIHTISTQFEIELRKVIDEQLSEAMESLVTGVASDFADYKFKVGRITALRQVLDYYCDEVNAKLNKQ